MYYYTVLLELDLAHQYILYVGNPN